MAVLEDENEMSIYNSNVFITLAMMKDYVDVAVLLYMYMNST